MSTDAHFSLGGNMPEYYNGSRAINSNAWLIMTMGNRSIGKTFYFSRYCVKQFLEKGRQFIYIRRYKDDIDIAAPKFFTDISNKFPDKDMYYSNGIFYIGDKGQDTKEFKVAGFAESLTRLSKLKSLPLSNVDNIFFDEFIPDDNRYLSPNKPYYEPERMLALYMTIARGYKRPIRDEVKIMCAANNVTLYSPYFAYYNIDLSKKEWELNNLNVYAEKTYNKSIASEIINSKIGPALLGTNYGEHALFNKSLVDDERNCVGNLPKNLTPWLSIYSHGWYTALIEVETGNLYFRKSFDKTLRNQYRLTKGGTENVESVPWMSSEITKRIKSFFERDVVFYDNIKTKIHIEGFFVKGDAK